LGLLKGIFIKFLPESDLNYAKKHPHLKKNASGMTHFVEKS